MIRKRRNKITIIGAGNVGSTAAHWAAARHLGDIVLVDIIEGLAKGKALDLMETAPVEHTDYYVIGSGGYEETENSDVIVVTAGLARRPGMNRDDLLKKNFEIVRSCVEQAVKYSPESYIIMVSNPLDIMTYVARQVSGFEKNRVMGMAGLLDSARLRLFVAMELGISVEDVKAFVLGGHGDSMVPLVRYCYAGGIPIEKLIPPDRIKAIVDRTRNAGGEIVSLLKDGSAYYSPAAATVQMVEAILKDKKRIVPCSACLEGEYDVFDGLYVGVPVILGGEGTEKVIEIDLADEEMKALQKSVDDIRENVQKLPF
jgi:malate dehydrogenase